MQSFRAEKNEYKFVEQENLCMVTTIMTVTAVVTSERQCEIGGHLGGAVGDYLDLCMMGIN